MNAPKSRRTIPFFFASPPHPSVQSSEASPHVTHYLLLSLPPFFSLSSRLCPLRLSPLVECTVTCTQCRLSLCPLSCHGNCFRHLRSSPFSCASLSSTIHAPIFLFLAPSYNRASDTRTAVHISVPVVGLLSFSLSHGRQGLASVCDGKRLHNKRFVRPSFLHV